ncbi:capsid protein [Marmot picobirnavirus]|nr:capsid protein [Marmot picobirnavirus]
MSRPRANDAESKPANSKKRRRPKKSGGNQTMHTEQVAPVVTGSSDNDPNWYLVNGQMAKDVLSLGMDITSGLPFDMHSLTNVAPGHEMKLHVPGVMVYNVMPTLPINDGPLSSVNVCANTLYQAVQSKNSRTPSYEASDLMLYFIALANALSAYQWAVRVYGTMLNYSYIDRYTPKALVQAMGVDYQDLKSNLANFRTGLNQIAAVFTSLYIPKSVDYVNRQVFLYEAIYADSDTTKAQYYMYNPLGFYKWIEGDSETPLTHLDFVPMLNDKITSMTADNIIEYLNDLLMPLRVSDDIRMIGADMINAFGVESMYKVFPISETFLVKPSYNKEVLMQFENAFIMPPATLGAGAAGPQITASLTQTAGINEGAINFNCSYNSDLDSAPLMTTVQQYKYNPVYRPDIYLLNFHENSVSSEMMLVASRLTQEPEVTITWPDPVTYMTITINKAPTTELILGATIYSFGPDSEAFDPWDIDRTAIYTYMWQQHSSSAYAMLSSRVNGLMSRFDWSPRIVSVATSSGATTKYMNYGETIFDLDNYTILPNGLLTNVNYMANLGLFTPKSLPNAVLTAK